MFKSRVNAKYVLADFQKWQGTWVHYTDYPELKVNPKSFHNDPAALYFFPASFETKGSWHKKRYKFVAEIPADLKVLDLSEHNTPEKAYALIEKLGATPDEAEQKPQIKLPWESFEKYVKDSENPIDQAWGYLQQFFISRSGLFNKRLREAGYDAVFDDTGSIHTYEVQLLVLDPRKIKNARRVDNLGEGSGHKEVQQIMDLLAQIAKEHGWFVDVDKPKKKWDNWDKQNKIKGSVTIKKLEGDVWETKSPYMRWEVSSSSDNPFKKKGFSTKDKFGQDRSEDRKWLQKQWKQLQHSGVDFSQIEVSLSSSTPQWREHGTSYRENIREFKMEDVKRMLEKAIPSFIKFSEEK